ncbi:uncharacterized protein LOC126685726 [Mercurialis annua]|uniref:uncharacterized protein LOC126685726 n=1 Tax=Mercurialis annua TaxID=3986 RepID=UPI00215F6959|nr:uncharacterized protein LOC126685726 [Mercurialis annua]
MEDSVDFPGFQICTHREEFEYRKALSRLQRRAPCPLQIKPNDILQSQTANLAIGFSITSSKSESSEASSFGSFYHSKDPIPLLSPLVSPSLIPPTYIQEGKTAKSH